MKQKITSHNSYCENAIKKHAKSNSPEHNILNNKKIHYRNNNTYGNSGVHSHANLNQKDTKSLSQNKKEIFTFSQGSLFVNYIINKFNNSTTNFKSKNTNDHCVSLDRNQNCLTNYKNYTKNRLNVLKKNKFDLNILQTENKKENSLFNNYKNKCKISQFSIDKKKNNKNYSNIITHSIINNDKDNKINNKKDVIYKYIHKHCSTINNINDNLNDKTRNISSVNVNPNTNSTNTIQCNAKNSIKSFSILKPNENEPLKIYQETIGNTIYNNSIKVKCENSLIKSKNKTKKNNKSSNNINNTNSLTIITSPTNININHISEKNKTMDSKIVSLNNTNTNNTYHSNNNNISSSNNNCPINLKNKTKQLKSENLSENSNSTILFPKSNSDNNDSIITTDSKIYFILNRKINEIELNLQKEEYKNNTSKSKKYNYLKNNFDSLIKTIMSEISQLSNTFLKYNNFSFLNSFTKLIYKIFIGIHEVVLCFSNENRTLKENNNNYLSNINKINNKVEEYYQKILEKDKEIEKLKEKINYLNNNNSKNIRKNIFQIKNIFIPGLNLSDDEIKISNISSISNRALNSNKNNNKILSLNKQNLSDLDALYFLDKINVDKDFCQSVPKEIPKLDFCLCDKNKREMENFKMNNANNDDKRNIDSDICKLDFKNLNIETDNN